MSKATDANSLKIIPLICNYYNGYKISFSADLTLSTMAHYEIDIITRGRAHLVIDDVTYRLYPGDICFRKPGQTNTHLIDTPYECLHLKFDVTPCNSESFFNNLPTIIKKKDGMDIQAAIMEFHKHYCYNSEYNKMMCEAMLIMLKAALYKLVFPESRQALPPHHATIQKAIDHMKKNIDTQIKVEEIAEYCGYSAKHFQKLFKEGTGATPHKYLLRLRIELAKQLLLTTSDSVGQISLKCGFFDSNYFTEAFKKHTGITPTKFKTQNI